MDGEKQLCLVYVKANTEQPVFEMREITLGNKLGANYSKEF
jgi:hypothetical protein